MWKDNGEGETENIQLIFPSLITPFFLLNHDKEKSLLGDYKILLRN